MGQRDMDEMNAMDGWGGEGWMDGVEGDGMRGYNGGMQRLQGTSASPKGIIARPHTQAPVQHSQAAGHHIQARGHHSQALKTTSSNPKSDTFCRSEVNCVGGALQSDCDDHKATYPHGIISIVRVRVRTYGLGIGVGIMVGIGVIC